MPWVKVDDHFDEHPKMARVGPLGWAMWLAGLAYCNRNLTDGFIPYTTARRLVSWDFLMPRNGSDIESIWTVGINTVMHGEDVDSPLVIGMLVDAGLWEEVPGGYRVHDYMEYQPSKLEVVAEREKWAAKKRRGRPSRGDSPGDSQGDSTLDSAA